ncbi:serine/threonine-protein kinase [Kitasatospora sp. LaBMicrA B282]|uniref:serine/threonine-protein kinase n=1 Tax=Kitasatospora sp. LaBMicrA B282 TaxID=3420949 RepID=UPI003D1373FD
MALQQGDPSEIGGYRLEDRLGAGGMGVVYRGRSVSGRQVAVKVIRPELAEHPEFRTRFRHEVDAARLVSGAFTAPVLDADADAPAPWLATSYIAAPSLADRVARQGPLTAPAVRQLATGLAEALRDIHRVGLVHRDLKPGNVLLADDGPRVIDFGIARAFEGTQLTTAGVVVGTPPYMAPEQFRLSTATPATDVFALGSVLAYAATGRVPFGTDSAHAVGFRVVYEEPDLTGVPEELRPLILACLAKAPEQRPTVDQLLGRHPVAAPAPATVAATVTVVATGANAPLGRPARPAPVAPPAPAGPPTATRTDPPAQEAAEGSASIGLLVLMMVVPLVLVGLIAFLAS